MIVYGHHSTTLPARDVVRRIVRRIEAAGAAPTHDALVAVLVELGEAYAAVADARAPETDDLADEYERRWRAAMQLAARAFYASSRGALDDAGRPLRLLRDLAADLERAARADLLTLRVPEGFAFHALLPEQYASAAGRLIDERRPSSMTCIGIRSIGAPLAHVVAAAAADRGVPADVFTIRPRGHPFDRSSSLSDRLRAAIRRAAIDWVAIVDEGPGISGSSFAAAADAVTALGVPAERIALFPSWTPAALSLRSHRGRAVFRDHAVYVDAPPLRQFDTWTDVSAGAWRSFVFGTDASRWPAVHPQHERRKYLAPDGRSIARFVGLGRFGEALRERAERLADAGFGARVRALRSGFLTLEWTGGNPLSAGDAEQPHVLARIATYLATLRRQFASGAPARTDDLAAMIEVNLGEAGASIPLDAATLLDAASGFDQPAIALDGRMMPHEWVSGGRRLLKVDALDHHADDFLPGARDIAWDLAGAIAELRLDGDATNFFVDCYRRVSADHSIDRRLPFYRLAYLAYRLGYVSLAADTLANTADAHAFSLLRARYRRSLAALGQTRRPARARSRSPGRPRCDG